MRDYNKYKTRCVKCNESFFVSACRKETRKYCSKQCQNRRYAITCIKCESVFEVPSHKKSSKFCSQKCRESGRHEVVCDTCSKKFLVPEFRKETAKYCSVQCKNNFNALSLICMKCKQKFQRTKWKKSKFKDYCSSRCYYRREDEIFVTCNGCKVEIKIFPSQQKYYKNHYCSNECRIKFGSIGKLTDDICDNRNAYQRFVRSVRHCAKYYAWRSEVRDRDGEACVVCGSIKNTTVHHGYVSMYDFVRKYGFDKEKIYGDIMFFDSINGQVLCRSCHAKQHIKDN